MIATRSVERGRSALHKSSQLHSRLPYPFTLHSRQLMVNSIDNINNIIINANCCRRRHNDPAGRLSQARLAHTKVPFGWTHVDQNEEPPTPPDPNAFVNPPSKERERVPVSRRPTLPGFVLGPGPLLPREDSGRPGSISYYHAALKALLHALRRGDTFKLYLCLLNLVRGHETEKGSHAFGEVVASIPATTFSEILRNFDPCKVAEEIDTAPGVNISYGMAVHTPLGELVNKWGVKTLYCRILRRLLAIQFARRKARLLPLMNDYLVLMRCAGATSDHRLAKDIWYSMSGDRLSNFRHSEAYSEFIKARYLADKAYANNDLARLRLRPLDMHRSSLWVPGSIRLRLLHLACHITDRRKHRFGSNTHERFFEDSLTRILRMRKPLRKLERTAALRGAYYRNEHFSCTLLKANGRAGRMNASNGLLHSNWGVAVKRDRITGVPAIEGGHTYPPGSARAPTAALLDAVVHCYCCMGEITLAVRLLVHISQRFNMPVPDSVWSDLLEYTRVMQSKPAAQEWAIAKFPHKGARADQMLEIWSLCTQPPYSFRPGAGDYYNLIRSLVQKGGPMLRPIEALQQIKPLYDDAVHACEQAWCELMETTQQGVPNHGAFRRYKLLQGRKNHMLFMFHHSIFLILKGIRPGRVDDHSAVRAIPKLVGEFAQFLPRKVSYFVATGLVEFSSDSARMRDVVEVEQTVLDPAHKVRPGREESEDIDEDYREESEDIDEDDLAAHGWRGHLKEDDSSPAAPAARENEDEGASETLGSEKSEAENGRGPAYMTGPRWVVQKQEAEKPAYRYRPRYSGPSDQLSLLSIRRDGGEFTGYYEDPLRRHFAAYRVHRTTKRVFGVPIDLELSADGKRGKPNAKMVEDLLRIRA